MTELFWDLLKLDRGIWRYMKDDRVVLGLMKGLTEVFEGIYEGWPSSSGTNGRLGRCV